MGGYGSGRHNGGGKRAAGSSLGLDVRAMHRAGSLQPGARGSWKWWHDRAAPPIASISYMADADAVTLMFRTQGETVEQRVPLVWTACNYGGRRPWWRCPECSRRVAILYGHRKFFACRHCRDLCHASQLENPEDRALRRAWRIRRQLGQTGGGHMDPMPDKPKGMHWRTYYTSIIRARQAEAQSWSAAFRRLGLR